MGIFNVKRSEVISFSLGSDTPQTLLEVLFESYQKDTVVDFDYGGVKERLMVITSMKVDYGDDYKYFIRADVV